MAAGVMLGAFSLSRLFSAMISAGGPLIFRFGATAAAARIAILLLRTTGYLQNRFPSLYQFPGLPPLDTAAGRFLRPVPTFLNPLGFGIPFMGSFLTGFAFRDDNELQTGWLSFFGEMLLSGQTEGNTEEALKALPRGDAEGFFDQLGQAFSEESGLDFLASFFRGLATWQSDLGEVTGLVLPPNMLGEAVIFTDAFLDSFGGAFNWIADLLGVTVGGPPPRPPTPEELATGEEEIRRRLRQATEQAEKRGGDTGAVIKSAERLVRRFAPGFRDLITEFLAQSEKEPSDRGKMGLIRAAQRILRGK